MPRARRVTSKARKPSKDRVLCGYCGHIAATEDPIPPRCLLEKPYPPGLIAIPACFPCSHTFANDEAYVAGLLTALGANGGGDGRLDMERMNPVLRKIAFGLARQQPKKSPAWDDVVPLGVFPLPIADGRPQPAFLATHADRFRSKQWVHLQPGVFSYLLTQDPTAAHRRWCILNFREVLWGVVQLPGVKATAGRGWRQMEMFGG